METYVTRIGDVTIERVVPRERQEAQRGGDNVPVSVTGQPPPPPDTSSDEEIRVGDDEEEAEEEKTEDEAEVRDLDVPPPSVGQVPLSGAPEEDSGAEKREGDVADLGGEEEPPGPVHMTDVFSANQSANMATHDDEDSEMKEHKEVDDLGEEDEEEELEEELEAATAEPVSVMESEDLLRNIKSEPLDPEEPQDLLEEDILQQEEEEEEEEDMMEEEEEDLDGHQGDDEAEEDAKHPEQETTIKEEPKDPEDEVAEEEGVEESFKRKAGGESEEEEEKANKKKKGEEGDGESDKSLSGMKATNLRKNIREVMDETQLDEATISAQRQEMERLKRVQDQQKYIREVQRQIAINRQNNKTQTRVISLLQGNAALKSSAPGSSKPSTVLVKLSSNGGPPQVINKKVLEVLKSGKSTTTITDSKPGIVRIPNKPHMVTPSVSIAPVKPSAPAEPAKTKDVVTISSSSDEDDCIVISEPSDEEMEEEEDPNNSGMHTNDLYNIPDEQGRVLINVGKPENDPDVFLAPQIARVIKPHQIGGVRFMFDNVVESLERFDTSPGFGCILAHSMGLGKTLQVVSFCDVFLRETKAKTVMCIMPINTLQNWMAEFNMWLSTDPASSPLSLTGEVRPRNFGLFVLNDLHKTILARSRVVQEWKKDGGVLLIGYEMYRQLSLKRPARTRKGKKKIPDEDLDDEKNKPLLDEMHEALVKPGPDLVICDEGHRIKNSHASISHALKQIRTRRRIVLTGYPLQNNLQEYWCMVDFVRPNYLGSKTEFSNMFERPIQNGQCIDSTPKDIRLMRYRAHVLHSLLEGFVQRRSHAVLRNTLPQKEEYVLLVRMTSFQRTLYDTFMNEVVRTKAVPNPLKAFAVCCKIWNHPDILYNFLKKREMDELQDLDLEEAAALAPGANPGIDPNTARKTKDRKGKGNTKKAQAVATPIKNPAVATVQPNTSQSIDPKQEPGVSTDTQGQFGPNFNQSYPYQQYNNTYGQNYSNQGGSEFGNNYNQNYSGNFYNQYPGYYPGEGSSYNWSQQYNYSNYYSGFGGEPSGGFFNQEGGESGNDFKPPKTETGEFSGGFNQKFQQPNWPNQQHGNYGTTNPGSFPPKQQQGKVAGDGQTEQKYTPNKSPKESFNEPNYPLESPQNKMVGYQQDSKHGSYSGQDFQQQTKPSQEQGGAFQTSFPPQAGGYHPGQERPNSSVHFKEASSMKQPEPGKDSQKSPGKFSEQQFGHDLNKNDNFGQGFNYNNYQQQTGCSVSGQFGKLNPQEGAPGGERSEGRVGGGSGYFNQDQTPNKFGNQNFSGDKQQQGNQFSTSSGGSGNQFSQNELQFGSNQFGSPPRGQFTDLSSGQNKRAEPEKASSFPAFSSQKEQFGGQQFGGSNQYGKPTDQVSKVGSFGIQNICNDYKEDQGSSQYDHQGVQQKGQFGSTQFGKENASTSISQTDFGLNDFGNESRMSQYDASRSYPYGGQFGKKNTQAQFGNQMSDKNCFGSTPNSSFQGQQQSFQPTNQFGTQPNTSSQSSTQTTTTTHYQDRSQFSVQNQKTQNEFGNQNQYSTQTGNKYGNQSVPSGQTNQFQNQGGGQFEGQTTNQQKVGSNQKASNQYAGGQYGGAPPPNQNLPQNASLNFNQFGNQTQFTPTSQSHGLPSSHSSANQFTGGNQQGNQFQNPSSQGGQYATNQFPSSNLHSGQYSGANFPPNQQANQFSNSNQQGSQAAQQNDQFTSTNPLNQGGSNQFSGPNLLGTQQGGNQFPGPNLSVSNKQASNQFSSPNLASNQQGGNQYSNNSQQGGNQHSSSNLPVNQQTTNQFSSSNLQSNQQGGNQFSNPSQQAGNQFSGSNRPSNQQGGNHFSSNNLSMNQQGSNQFSGSNLPGNQQGGNSFSGSNMPGNQFSSPNLPVSQQGGSQLSNANLAGNHQGSNQFTNPGQQGSNQFSNTLLLTNQSGGNQFSNPSVPSNQQGGNQFPRNENQGSNQFTRSDNQGGNQFARTDTQGGNQFVRADTQGGSQFVRADNQGGNQFTGPNHQSGNLFSNPNQQANTQFSNTNQQGGHPNHSSSQLGQFSPPNQQGSNQFQNTNQQSSSQFSPASQQTSQYSQGSQFGNSGLTSNNQFASGNSNQHGNQFSNVVGQQSGRFSSGPAPSNQQSSQFPGGPSINQQGVQFPGSSASTNQQSVQFSGGPAPNQQGVQFLGGSASSNQQTGQFSAAGGQQSGQYPGSSAPSNQQSGQFSGGSSSSNQQNSQFSSSSASMNQQNAQFTGGSTSSSQQTGQFSNATALQSTQFPHSSNQLGGQFCNTVGQQRGQFTGSSPSVNQQSSQYSGTSTPSGQQSGQFSNTIDQPSGQFPGGSATTNQQSIQFPNNSGSLNQQSGQFSNIGGQQFSNGSTSMNQQSNQFSGSSTSTNQQSMQFPGSSASANQQSGQFSNIGGQQTSQFPTSSMTQQGNQFSSGSASMNQQNTQFTGSTASTNQQSGQFSNAGNQQSSGQFSNAGNQQSGQFSNAGNQQSGQFNNSSVSTNQQSGQFSTSSTSTNQQSGQFSNTGSQQSSQFSTGTPSTNQQSGQFPNTGSQQSGQFSSGSTSTNQQSGQCSNNGVSQFPNSGSQYQGKQFSNHSLGGPFSQHPSGQFQPMPIPGQQSDQFLAGNQSGNQFPSHGGNQFPGTSQQSSQFGNQFGAANNLPGGYHHSQSGQQNTPVPFQGGGYGDQSVPSVAQPQGKSAQFQGGLPGDPGQDGGNLQASNCPQNKYGMYNQFGKAPEQFGPRANEFEANKQGTSCQTDPVETSGVERVEGSGEKDDCITKDTGCEPRKDNDPMSDPKRLGDVAGTSVTTVQKIKEDPGIPYDWAIELLKGYIPGKIEASAKMAVFFCILEESIALGDRILVFSQSLFTLNLMEELLQQQLVPGKEEKWLKNINYYRLDGSTSALEREKLINEFNSNPNLHLFLVSTRAGSLGINLVGANRVIVFDASWNPCHDTQAVCRVYRYGQKKPCFVYRLVTDNCLEKKIYDRQINKQGMADRVVDECNPEAHLSIKEVTSLCWDDQEDNGPKDFTDLQHKYIDVVIQKVLQKHSSLLSKEPFHHESLLVDRKDKKLSQAEKRLAKRSYELEKQANSNNARPVYNHYPNNIGTQAGVQIRGMRQDKPMASVRPMQSELGSQLVRDGRQQQRGWIPASVWQRQGMSAQEMTLPLDVVIPTNSPDRASIVLKAGQKVMVLKSPKGIYMQLENGKIIAIRTAFKVGQKDKKGMDKPEPKKDASTGPRPRHTLPNLRNSSISIIPRSSMGPRGPTNTKPVRLLGPKPIDLKGKQPMAAARPYIREPPVTVTVTKKRLPEPSTSETKVNPPPLQLQPKTRLQENSDSSDIETFDPPSSEEPRQLPQQQRFPHMMDIPETSLSSTPSVAVESLKTQGVVDPPAAGCSSDIPEIGLARSELSIQRVTPSKPKVLQDSATKSEVGTQMSVETQPQPIQPIPAMPTVEPLQVPTMSQKSHDSRKTPPPTIGEIYPLPEPSTQAGLSSNIQEHFHRPESTEQPFELYKKLDTFPPRSQQNIYEPYKKPEVKSPRVEESHRSPRKAEPFPQVDSSRSPRSSEGFRVASKTPPSVEKGYPPSTRDDSKSTLSEAIVARPEPFQPTSALPNLGHAVSIFPVGKSATQFDYGYPPRPDYYPAYPPYSSYKPDLPLQYPPAMYGAPGEGYAHQPNPFSAAAAATRAPPAPFDPDYSRYSAFHRPEVVQPATAAAGAPPPTTAPAPPPPSTYTPYAPYNPFLITPPPPQYLAPNPPPPNPPQ